MLKQKLFKALAISGLVCLGLSQVAHGLTMQEILQGYDNPKGRVLGAGTPAFVQFNQTGVSGDPSVSANFTSANTAGNAIIVYMFSTINGSASYFVSDTQGNTYNSAINFTGSRYNQIWYATNIKAGANTVTVNFGGPSLGALLFIHEYSGISVSLPLDVTSAASGNGVAMDSGSAVVSQPNELIFGAGEPANNVTSPGNGFARRGTLGSNITEDKVVVNSGSYSASATGDGGAWDMLMATFKSDDGGNPPPTGDTAAPSTPTNLSATAVSASAINLSWTASSDNVGVTGYKIFRGGVQVGTSVTNSYSDAGLSASTQYTYTVSAYDAAGNNSSQSTSASATTQAGTVGASGNIYIAQTSAGSNNGSSCANAYAVSFFNTASNWGTGAGQIGPGTTVHLCGTFTAATANTTMLTVLGSGTSGNSITIKFELNALLTSPAWSSSHGAIFISSSYNYITIDGGTNGIIEDTLNGTAGYSACLGGACTYQINSGGVYSDGAFTTVQNLTITHIYMHQEDANDPAGAGSFGIILGGDNSTITRNKVSDMDSGVAIVGNNSTISFNEISNFNHGAIAPNAAAGTTITGMTIHDNNIHDAAVWDDPSVYYHHDPIFSYLGGGNIDGLMIYNNYVHGVMGAASYSAYTTSWFFLDPNGYGNITNTKVFNNIFEADAIAGNYNYPNDGFFGVFDMGVSGAAANSVIVNNTIVDNGNGGMCWHLQDQTGTSIVKNNLCQTIARGALGGACLRGPSPWPGTTQIDYNIYAGVGSSNDFAIPEPGGTACGNINSFSAWQGYGFDLHGSNPSYLSTNLDGNYIPQAGSVAIKTGANLTSLGISQLNVDKNGTPRPSSGAWDIGAYQVSSGGGTPTPLPGDLNLDHVINALDYSILNSHWLQNYPTADINTDGLVNSLDFAILKSNWGKTW
jgi:chitodextrinase